MEHNTGYMFYGIHIDLPVNIHITTLPRKTCVSPFFKIFRRREKRIHFAMNANFEILSFRLDSVWFYAYGPHSFRIKRLVYSKKYQINRHTQLLNAYPFRDSVVTYAICALAQLFHGIAQIYCNTFTSKRDAEKLALPIIWMKFCTCKYSATKHHALWKFGAVIF